MENNKMPYQLDLNLSQILFLTSALSEIDELYNEDNEVNKNPLELYDDRISFEDWKDLLDKVEKAEKPFRDQL